MTPLRPKDGDSEGSRMPTLGELISARRKDLGWTYDRLSEESDGALSKQRWQQLGTDTRVNEFPEPRTLQLIADTIGVGVDRVILSTAVTLGVDIPDDRSRFATMLPPNADELTDDQRAAVYAVIRAMRPATAATFEPKNDDYLTLDGPPLLQVVHETSNSLDPASGSEAFLAVAIKSLIDHYDELFRRASLRSPIQTQQAESILQDDLDPGSFIEPEIGDRLYLQYLAARHSTPVQGGDPDVHAATSLDDGQFAAAQARYRREMAEAQIFGRIRTVGIAGTDLAKQTLQSAARTAPPGYKKGRGEHEGPDT